MPDLMWRTVLMEPGRFAREQVPMPAPGPDEVLVHATHVGLCGSDISAFTGEHPYFRYPVVLGHEFSGVVIARNNAGPAVGTRVSVLPHVACWHCDACRREHYNLCESLKCIGAQCDGAHAEYIAVPERMAIPIPDEMSLEDAALVEPAAVSYHAMLRANLTPGENVLISGAGAIGAFAVQTAKVLGAGRVFTADIDASRLELATSLGADGVIFLPQESISEGLTRLAGGIGAVSVFADCVGKHGDALDELICIAPRGSRVVMVGVLSSDYCMPHFPDAPEHELTLLGTTMYVPADYQAVIRHMSTGAIRTTGMVTHRRRFSEIADTFAMIQEGREPFFKIMFEREYSV